MPRFRTRDLPAELVHALRVVRQLEDAASNHQHRLAAIRATSALMLACIDAGWRSPEICDVIGLNDPAGRKRIEAARRRGNRAAVNVPEPIESKRPRAKLLATPVAEREWLRIDEAAEFAGVSRATVRVWRRAGLLPNTQWLTRTYPVFLRADLLRVLRAPRTRHGRGVDHGAALALIKRAAV